MMKLEESRKQFEELVCREMPSGTVIADPKWWAYKLWQASRENLPKIKLPGVNFSSTFYVDIENRVINKCKQAIHEAGYEVE